MKWIDDRIAILPEAQAVVSFGSVSFNNKDVEVGTISKVTSGTEQVTIRSWGKNNNMPQVREGVVNSNNIVPALLATKRDMLLGAGLMAYKERYEEGTRIVDEVPIPPMAKMWMDDNDFETDMSVAARELMIHANVYTEMVRNKGGQILSSKTQLCAYTRAGEKDDHNHIPAYFWSPAWALSSKEMKKYPIERIEAYIKGQKQPKFMLHTYDDLCRTDDYYYAPTWWGGWQWIDLANAIPHFHRANLQHGYSIRYHIEVPSDYFDNNTPEMLTDEKVKDEDSRKALAKENFLNGLNDFLAGVKNAGRTVITEYEINRTMGKDFPGIKITPLTIDMKDEALLKLFQASNQANISAQGIHPTLAAVETAGKLSSGSEIKNAFTMYMAIKAPTPRRILLAPLHMVARENKWPSDIKYGFRDIQLTSMDESKTGTVEDGSITV
jgi:hypothetical protein